MQLIEISSALVRASVATTAAMVVDAGFEVGGRTVRPYARAPWIGEAGLEAHPGHVRVLGGDFVGLPFGAAGTPHDVIESWTSVEATAAPEPAHGYAGDADFTVTHRENGAVTLRLDFPESEAIEYIERTIRASAEAPRLDFELVIHARRDTAVPVGLHPILRLPEAAGDLRLTLDFERGYTYPGTVPPGAALTAPGAEFGALNAVPALGAGTIDISALPLNDSAGAPSEDIVLLANALGPLRARYLDDNTEVVLDWDRNLIPSLMLWISDRALVDEPWNGRYRGLGTEPIASAFDFPASTSLGPNPLATAGYRTAVTVSAAQPVTIRHSVQVSSISAYV